MSGDVAHGLSSVGVGGAGRRPGAVLPGLPANPWPLPLLVLLGVVLLAVQRGLLSTHTVTDVGRWLSSGPLGEHIGVPEALTALAAGLMAFVSWRWPVRLLAVAGTWVFATLVPELLSDGRMARTVSWLASQPGVDVFEAPPRGFLDAVFVLGASFVLIPLLGLVLLVLVWAWSAFFREIITPMRSRSAFPDWALTLSVLSGLSFAAYAENAVWLPWGSWVLGVIARAYLIVSG